VVANSDDNDDHNELEPECIATYDITEPTSEQLQEFRTAIRQGGGAYMNNMPLYQQMAGVANANPRLYSIFSQGLSQTLSLMQGEARAAFGAGTTGSIISQPNVDHTQRCKRLKQKTSPKKRGKKK
jgi:hypothetical protein